MKKALIFLGSSIIFIAIVVGLWVWSSTTESKNAAETPINTDIVLFYGQDCPHCKDVEKFIAENGIAEKVKFDSLEVWHNKANSNILLKKAQECNIAEDKTGVPFLYSKGECHVGTPDIEKFFKQAAGIQ